MYENEKNCQSMTEKQNSCHVDGTESIVDMRIKPAWAWCCVIEVNSHNNEKESRVPWSPIQFETESSMQFNVQLRDEAIDEK